MLFWFVATSVLTIVWVFRDPRFDYRFLIVGALLPDLIDACAGKSWAMHSLPMAVALMTVVMLATIGRRPLRKKLLAIPIGVMLHLVFDGAFSTTEVFWWPFTSGFGNHPLPVVARGWWNLLFEAAGLGMLWWAYGRFGLARRDRRDAFRTNGHLTEVAPPPPPPPAR